MKPTPKIVFIQAALLLLLAMWSFLTFANVPMGERIITSRYFMMGASALYAFFTPYLLFPDPRLPIHQLGNASPGSVLNHLFRRSSLLFLVPVAITLPLYVPHGWDVPDGWGMMEGAQNAAFWALQAIIFYASLWAIAVLRYLKTGERSQFWKESARGQALQHRLTNALKTPIDAGSLPTLLETILLTTAGMLTVATGALLTAIAGPASGLLPTTLLFIYAILYTSWRLLKRRDILHNYYRTNAFFREYFRTGLDGKEEPITIKAEELWWVPATWRADVLPLLVQMDRKIPSSRWIYAGHGLMWILAWQQPDPGVMLTAWTLFIASHHLPLLITASDQILPVWFARWLGSPWHWMKIRSWMQLRWLLLLALSIFFQQSIFDAFSGTFIFEFLIGYLGMGVAMAWLTTLRLIPAKKPRTIP